jgi:hypothetical protein
MGHDTIRPSQRGAELAKRLRKQRKRKTRVVRPEIMAHVRRSIAKNRKLLALLAR